MTSLRHWCGDRNIILNLLISVSVFCVTSRKILAIDYYTVVDPFRQLGSDRIGVCTRVYLEPSVLNISQPKSYSIWYPYHPYRTVSRGVIY